MTVPAELVERAKAHGLKRTGEALWADEARNVLVIWTGPEWRWGPPRTANAHMIPYPSEADALTAALQWLDLQHPDRAHKPQPWAPITQAVELVRKTRWEFSAEAMFAAEELLDPKAIRDQLDAVIALLTRTALGPHVASRPEVVLHLLLDLAQERGELGAELRAHIVRALQARPDEAVQVVAALRIAGPWADGRRYALHHDADIGETEELADVRKAGVEDVWFADVESLPLLDEDGEPMWGSAQGAKAAADALLQTRGYGLVGGAVQAPEEQEPDAPRPQLIQAVQEAIAALNACPDASDRLHMAYEAAGLRHRRIPGPEYMDEETLRRYLDRLQALVPAPGQPARCLDCDPGDDCPRCGGTGLAVPCPRCEGSGTLSWGRGDDTYEGACPTCSGGADPEDGDWELDAWGGEP